MWSERLFSSVGNIHFLVIKQNTQWPKWPWQSLPRSSRSLHTVDAKTLPMCPLASKVFTPHAASDLFQRDNAAKVVNIQSDCLYFNSWEVSTRGSIWISSIMLSDRVNLCGLAKEKVSWIKIWVYFSPPLLVHPLARRLIFSVLVIMSLIPPTVHVLAFNMNSNVSLPSPRLERQQFSGYIWDFQGKPDTLLCSIFTTFCNRRMDLRAKCTDVTLLLPDVPPGSRTGKQPLNLLLLLFFVCFFITLIIGL